MIVSDNDSTFTHNFLMEVVLFKGYLHLSSLPPNSLTERTIQTFKQEMSGLNESQLSDFLFYYYITLHSSTGSLIADVLFGQQLRFCLDLFFTSRQ